MIISNFLLSLENITLTFLNVRVFHQEKKWIWIKYIISIFLCTFCLQLANESWNYLICSLFAIMLLFTCFFKDYKSLITSIYVFYFIQFIFEILFLMVLKLFHVTTFSYLLINFFSSILTLIFNNIFKDILIRMMLPKDESKNYQKIVLILNCIITALIIFINIKRDYFTYEVVFLLFLLVILKLSLSLLIEKNKTEDYIKSYEKMNDYTEFNENLLSEYKSFVHEYKNKLIIIKGMVSPRNHELHNYLDTIINAKIKNNYYWLMEIKNIPIPGIKGLINYKLLKMKELHIETEVYVSEEVAKLKKNNLDMHEKNDLYTMLGVFLDNAIEAALESNEKRITLHFFKEENGISITLANTFKSINLDELEDKGYSTKGKNRGYGLYLVKEILKHSKHLTKETSIINNYFVQKIIIKI